MLMACGKIACCAMAFANNRLKTDENVLECDDIAELSTPAIMCR